MSSMSDQKGNKPCQQPRVLIVAPHQDDECIGCGGMMARYQAEGSVVGVVYVAQSATGETIGSEARASCHQLGISAVHGLGIAPVGSQLCEKLLLDMIQAMRNFAPDIVYAPHPDEDDAHHRMVAALTREATWLASYPLYPECGDPLQPVQQLYWYEVWTPLARPTHIRDITPFVEQKLLAIQAYQSQVAITRFDEAALSLNRYRGVLSGVGEYAEAFSLVYHHESATYRSPRS